MYVKGDAALARVSLPSLLALHDAQRALAAGMALKPLMGRW